MCYAFRTMGSEYVSQRARQDVFILGAGFSRAISESMPLLRDLPPRVLSRLGKRALEAESVPFMTENVEMALSYLSQRHPWLAESEYLRNRALALEIAAAIGAELNARTAEVLRDVQPVPDWLSRLVHWMHRHQSVIITFNYDTLLERAFATIPTEEGWEQGESTVYYEQLLPRGMFAAVQGALGIGPVRTAEVLKLHGSLNWFYSGRASYHGELIHEVGYGGWTFTEKEFAGDGVFGRVPLIVPPVTDKGSYFEHEGVRFLWNLASQRLREAKRIFAIGYSLPATDLPVRFLLRSSSIAEGVPVYIVDVSEQPAQQWSALLARAVDERYIRASPVVDVADDLSEEDLSHAMSDAPMTKDVGPVQCAIRSHIRAGAQFKAFQRDHPVVVRGIGEHGLTLELGHGRVPAHYPWEVLEQVIPVIESANQQHIPLGASPCLDDAFRPVHAWATSRSVLPILQQAGVAEPYYFVNRWYVRLVGPPPSGPGGG